MTHSSTIQSPVRLDHVGPSVTASPVAVAFEHVSLSFDDDVILKDVSFTVSEGHMAILLGASGAGKSVILKLILGLLKPDAGTIRVRNARIDLMAEAELMRVREGIGMLFQESALFDSLSVADNIGYRLYEETDTPEPDVRLRVGEVLGFVGLDDYGDRLPSELSGGQRRRVALARAIAAKPTLLLLDEPTSGLDPITATTIDDQIVRLRDLERVTSILVTHQLRDAFYIAGHCASSEGNRVTINPVHEGEPGPVEFVMLKDGRIHFQGTLAALRYSEDPYLRAFLS